MKHNALHTIIITIIVCSAAFFSPQPVLAQHCKYYEISYKDSLVSDRSTSLLINNLKILNSRNKTTRMAIRIEVPKNWKNVATNKRIEGEEVYYNLAPGQTKVIPLNLIKLPKANTSWDSVKITVRLTELADTHTHYYMIMAAPNAHFEGEHLTDDVFLSERPEGDIPLKISLRNTGNVTDEYTVKYESHKANIHHKTTITLKPGQDTIYSYDYKMPMFQWADFYQDDIVVNVSSSKCEDVYMHAFNISKSRRVIKKQKYPYKSFPLILETGVLNFGNLYTYYVGASGNIDFAPQNNLSFNYRSKQIGREVYGTQRDMFTVTYNYYKWTASVGQIMSPQQFFMSNGRGGSLIYKPTNNAQYTVAVNLRDSNFFYNSNTFAAGANYSIGKKAVRQIAVADFNEVTATNGFVVSNEVDVINRETLSLTVSGGGGVESRQKDVPGVKKNTAGLLGGYAFAYQIKKAWSFASFARYFSTDMPGTQKGSVMVSHQITRNFKSGIFFGVNYSLNHVQTRYFIDTLYNTDVLRNNSERYGFTTGISNIRQKLALNFGYLKNSQVASSPQNAPYYADLTYSWIINSNSYLSMGVQNAFIKSAATDSRTLHATSLSGTAKWGFIGIQGAYTRMPLDNTDKNVTQKYQTTVTGGPFVNFSFFNRKLSGSLRYNISKSLYDSTPRQMVSGNVSYTAHKLGLSIMATGNLPLNSANINGVRLPISESKNFTISIVKNLNIPIPTKRKYVSMRSVAYNDVNNNGMRDEGEAGLPNVRVEISEIDTTRRSDDDDTDPVKYTDELYTNKNGEIRYLNVNKGVYEINVGDAESEGLIPAKSTNEKVVLQKNMSFEVPFKKARMITGRVNLVLDSFSVNKLTPDYIKITCLSSSGKKYVTLTDKKGYFFFNLPSGNYTVSLNPNAFKGSDFKPDQLEYEVNLTASGEEKVEFVVRQKKRKVRFMETKDGSTNNSKDN